FGTAAAANNWTTIATGPTPIQGAGGVSSDVNDRSEERRVGKGWGGYTNGTSYVCTGTGTQVDGTHVTVHVGQSETCTSSNTAHERDRRSVVCAVDPFGTAAAANNWTTIATGPTPIQGAGGVSSDVND